MNKNITFLALLGLGAASLGGCIANRTVTYPDYTYDTVFKSAVAGICSQKNLVLYEADKRKGVIKVEERSVWGNSWFMPVVISGAEGGVPSITVRGNDTRLETLIAQNLPEKDAPQGGSKVPGAKPHGSKAPGSKMLHEEKSDLDLERQKLQLEKERLEFEREKLEYEKKKLKGSN